MVSRADRSEFAEWWWTVDKLLLAGVFTLMIGGVVLSLAGSPAVAERLGYDSFHFVNRHIAFFLPALAVMIATSFLTPRQARRAALIVLSISLVLMLAVALRRRREQRLAALAQHRRPVAPAVGVHEAGLRRDLRLAVRRELAPHRHSRQRLRPHPARHRRRACSSPSPTSARRC